MLPFSEFCGLVGRLSPQYGAARSAAMGSAFHAKCSNAEDLGTWLAKLTPDERGEIAEWNPVADWTLEDGHVLRYEDGEREFEVAIRKDGTACKADDPDVLTVGHLDVAWVYGDTAYVKDIKRSAYTVTDGAATLQLLAYGWAYAAARGARYFVPAIWGAVEGERLVGPRIDLDDFATAGLWSRIEHAATNRGEASRGGHCMGCYCRTHCPEHMLPAVAAAGNLAAFAEQGPPLDAKAALEGLLLSKGLEDLATLLKDGARAWATQHGLRDPGNGKQYRPVRSKGKQGLISVAELRKKLGPKADELIKQGNPYDTWRWTN